ncbi:MAG: aspartate carbamoyltransferase [Candidatus Aenigmatarchaeota archaeon]
MLLWVLTTEETLDIAAFQGRDIISIKDFKREELKFLFDLTSRIKSEASSDYPTYRTSLSRKTVGLLFREPSTRTVGSFTQATINLGGMTNGIPNPDTSSFKKGESLVDAAKIIAGQGMCALVMRDMMEGGARLVAEHLDIPVINGGTGSEEHPTQAILDLYTIVEKRGSLDDLTVGIIGDLKNGRTVPSLSYALSLFDNAKIHYIAPEIFQVREEVITEVKNRGVDVSKEYDPRDVITHLDVLYVTRIQEERIKDARDLEDYRKIKDTFVVNANLVKEGKRELGIMHPLPRVDELSYDVDGLPNAWYFDQANNGVFARMAILYAIAGNKSK